MISYSSRLFIETPPITPTMQSQSLNVAQEPADGTQVKVRGFSENFLRKIKMENAESKKKLETESETQPKTLS